MGGATSSGGHVGQHAPPAPHLGAAPRPSASGRAGDGPLEGASGSIPPPDDAVPASVGTEFQRLAIHDRRGMIRIEVGVRPRSSRSAVIGVREGALAVALRAAPADGAANDELRALLAKSLEVRRGDVSIVLGASSRGKVVEVNGVTAEEARERLARSKR